MRRDEKGRNRDLQNGLIIEQIERTDFFMMVRRVFHRSFFNSLRCQYTVTGLIPVRSLTACTDPR